MKWLLMITIFSTGGGFADTEREHYLMKDKQQCERAAKAAVSKILDGAFIWCRPRTPQAILNETLAQTRVHTRVLRARKNRAANK